MSYFNDKFNATVEMFEAGTIYEPDTIVKYNGYLYIALKQTSEIPTPKKTDENWEFINPSETIRVLATIGCTNNGYPISIGTTELPFYSINAMNSINLTAKNKTNVPGFMGTLRFGVCMHDNGSCVNMNMLYDSDYRNPSLVGVTERLDEINLGTGIYRYKDIYLNSSPITLSDKETVKTSAEMDEKYLELFSKLTPVTYTLSSAYGHGSSNRTHIGFFANDLEDAMKEIGLSSDDFAGLVKIPILKKDIYKDMEINEYSAIHCHLENGEEVVNTEVDYRKYLVGENSIRYMPLPVYSKELGYIFFKNYPLGSLNDTLNLDIKDANEMDIVIKSLELIPYDETEESYKLDLKDLIIDDGYYSIENVRGHHEFLEDGSLKLSFDENSQYVFVRISFRSDGTPMDCSKYKYLKVVSDFKQPYLIGFSDVESIEEVDNAIQYTTSEYGDMYSYAQDRQYEAATHIYAIRYEEFIALNTKKIQVQDEEIQDLKQRVEKLEELISNMS